VTNREDEAQEVVIEGIVDRGFEIGSFEVAADLDLAAELSPLSLVDLSPAQAIDRVVLGGAHEPGARVVRNA
jgi:hypothetical protein